METGDAAAVVVSAATAGNHSINRKGCGAHRQEAIRAVPRSILRESVKPKGRGAHPLMTKQEFAPRSVLREFVKVS